MERETFFTWKKLVARAPSTGKTWEGYFLNWVKLPNQIHRHYVQTSDLV